MKPASALEELIDALRCLPGVGPKSAQRMAYHLLQYDPAGAQRLDDTFAAGNAAAYRGDWDEAARQYERLLAAGRLDAHRVKDDWEGRKNIAKTMGFIFFGTGLVLLALIVYAMISRLLH